MSGSTYKVLIWFRVHMKPHKVEESVTLNVGRPNRKEAEKEIGRYVNFVS